MGRYKHKMGDEKEPRERTLFNEGWNEWEVVSIKHEISKTSNNPMFVIEIAEDQSMKTILVYAVAVEGKQWLLKSFLLACGVSESADGGFDWDTDDQTGKRIQGFVENEPNTYINRESKEITVLRSKVTKFKSL